MFAIAGLYAPEMVTLIVLLNSLSISLVDVRTHRIPNRLNLALSAALIFDVHQIRLIHCFILCTFVLITSILCRVGGGDTKLLFALIITQGGFVASFDYLQGLLIATVLMVIATVMYRRSLQGSIALAPVILAPFLWLYLEI